ncbi:MAG: class I SAM-dependent methyltransferase [Chloroflexi bacterium]|nr:MAG: class I SAM-dependent methyltransferase [Chloroflexota bacterium]
MTEEISRIRHIYTTRYRKQDGDYSYVWHARNPVSYTFRQAQERAVINLLNQHNVRLEEARILDVGCGSGVFLQFLATLGAAPHNLYGVDLMEYRIDCARTLCPPAVHLAVEDAQFLSFYSNSFDLISQFTVFSSILDEAVRINVATEMDRVLKPGGFILWYDMKEHYKPDTHLQGINKTELQILFAGYKIIASRLLHHRLIYRLAHRSWLLCELIERIPGVPHTNMLALLQKP